MPTFGINQAKQGVEARFFELCEKVVSENNLSLYDLDYLPGQNTLRVFIIDKETESAVVEDCIKIDRAITPYVEEEKWMPETLTVEVSSPGIFRSLKETRHFEASIGKRVMIVIQGNLSDEVTKDWNKSLKSKKKFIGELESTTSKGIELKIENNNILVPINYEQIKNAQWEPQF